MRRRGDGRARLLLRVIWLPVLVLTAALVLLEATQRGERRAATVLGAHGPASAAADERGLGAPAAVTTPGATQILATPTPSPVPATPSPAPPTPAPTRTPADLLRFVGKSGDPLPADYVPPDLEALPPGLSAPPGLQLRHEAAVAFARMAAAARTQGILLVAVSTYRSFAEQAVVYQDEVRLFGKAQADRQVALPGRSEHQLGTTADISIPGLGYQIDDSLAGLPEGIWLRDHAWEYGFVLSYPAGKEEITGYRYEPWHFRYLGLEAARYIALTGQTSTETLAAHQTVGSDPALPRRALRAPRCHAPGPAPDC